MNRVTECRVLKGRHWGLGSNLSWDSAVLWNSSVCSPNYFMDGFNSSSTRRMNVAMTTLPLKYAWKGKITSLQIHWPKHVPYNIWGHRTFHRSVPMQRLYLWALEMLKRMLILYDLVLFLLLQKNLNWISLKNTGRSFQAHLIIFYYLFTVCFVSM